MAKRKKKPGARRRRRNPRMLAPARSGREAGPRSPVPEEVRSATPKEVAAAVYESLKRARAHLDDAETEAWLGASLKGYFLRVIETLEELLQIAAVFPEDFEENFLLFAQASGLFLPVLAMDWLPEDPQSFTREMTEAEREILETMQRHEADRQPDQPRGLWTPLLDMLGESAEVFLRFGYVDGLAKCYTLSDALAVRLGGPPAPPLPI